MLCYVNRLSLANCALEQLGHLDCDLRALDIVSWQGVFKVPGVIVSLHFCFCSLCCFHFQAIGFGLLGVFVVTFLFQLNPWLSIIICLLILSIDIELIGFMRLIDVNLNPISVANLVISIGMAVEFTAHYARAFLLAQGTRDERMKVALHEMLQPMVNGALSTIIALSVLSLAEFPFFRRYYALTYVIMVLVSFINGLVLLPVILSLIGPPARDNTNKKLTQEVDAEGTNGIELH